MTDSPIEFLRSLADRDLRNVDRAVALLWWTSRDDPALGLTPTEITDLNNQAGYSQENVSRLKTSLATDRRTANAGSGKFRIRVNVRQAIANEFDEFLGPRPIPVSDSLLPMELFKGTRGYLEQTAKQINGSFDCGFYDCTAVMCRRLLETLIIEAFESKGLENSLKGSDGNFMMFSGLLGVVENGSQISLGRNGLTGLKDFKKLGDLSAHSRRFNAREADINRIRDGVRIAAEELLHIRDLA